MEGMAPILHVADARAAEAGTPSLTGGLKPQPNR